MSHDTRNSSQSGAGYQQNLRTLEQKFAQLMGAPILKFDDRLRSSLPEAHGVYRIFAPTTAETLRAGRTKTAAAGLRQRVYQNHLMGNQTGNLRAQLVNAGVCKDLEDAKTFIRRDLAVQILVIDDDTDRIWFEHFMLGVLRPRFCD
jgi:hypothetical protein